MEFNLKAIDLCNKIITNNFNNNNYNKIVLIKIIIIFKIIHKDFNTFKPIIIIDLNLICYKNKFRIKIKFIKVNKNINIHNNINNNNNFKNPIIKIILVMVYKKKDIINCLYKIFTVIHLLILNFNSNNNSSCNFNNNNKILNFQNKTKTQKIIWIY